MNYDPSFFRRPEKGKDTIERYNLKPASKRTRTNGKRRPKDICVALAVIFVFCMAASVPAPLEAARGVKPPAAETASASAPFVVKTYPEDGEIDVALDSKIMATFNKKMREEDINEFSVTLNDGISDISTTVRYNNELCKLVVTPLENLQAGHSYFVTISRMVRDLNGTTMVSDRVWKFTTVKKADKNPPVIVDVSPTVSASNVPTNAKIEILFNKRMFEPSINENTITVKRGREKIVGAIRYYPDVNKAVFAPVNPLKPDSLFEVNISPEICDASRNQLASAYNYTFKTAAAATASQSLASANESGAAEALIEAPEKLAVDKTVTTNSRVKKLMAKAAAGKNGTSPAIEAGAEAEAGGDEYAIDDADKPGYREKKAEIIEMFPAPSADMINVDEKIKIRFNKRMNPGTFNIFNFALQDGNEYIFGKIEYIARTNTAVFTPAGKLKTGRKYRVTVSEKIEDIFGERLARDYSWEFTTISGIATTRVKDLFNAPNAGGKDALGPNVIAVSPRDNEENVAAVTQVSAVFDEPVKDFSINSFTFRLLDGESETRGRIYYDAQQKKAIFTPAQPLMEGRAYTAQITTGVMDLAGNYLQREKKWKFIVGKSWNKRSPAVVKITPDKGETDVDVSTAISVYFDRKMKSSTITPYSFFVTDGAKSVQGRVIYEQETNKAVFAPWSTLAPNKLYNVTLAKTIQDIEGMGLAETMMWQFKTGSGLSGRIASAAGATSIAAGSDANMQIKLQKAMGSSSLTGMSSSDPAALEAVSELGANEPPVEKAGLKNMVPVAEVAERMSVSDKSALGKVKAQSVADTVAVSELHSDDSPDEMKRRVASSDRGAYGNLAPRRIKDTVDRTDVIDEAMNETLKDQIAKFLSDDYKTSAKLAAQIDALPSSVSPVNDARANGIDEINEGRLESANGFIETPREAAAVFNRTNYETAEKTKTDAAQKFNGQNSVYTKADGINPALEIQSPKSVFTQMSDPPSKENSVYSPNPAPDKNNGRKPKLSTTDGVEGLVKLEKIEKYGDDNKNEPLNDETDHEAPTDSGGVQAGADIRPENPAQPAPGETAASRPQAPLAPKGMINGIPIEQIMADTGMEPIAQASAPNAKNATAPVTMDPSIEEPSKASGGDAPASFKSVGPGLSDVGTIPRDGKTNFFVTAIYPNKNMEGVQVDSTITAAFSMELDPSSINGASFVVSGAEGKVDGKILYNQRMKKVIFRPASHLEHGIKYSVQLTPAIKSSTGQALLPLNWSFTTK